MRGALEDAAGAGAGSIPRATDGIEVRTEADPGR